MNRLLILLCLACAVPGCDASSSGAASQSSADAPETEDQKTLYALGQLLGRNIEGAGLTEAEVSFVAAGLSDTALRREPKIDLDEYGPLVQGFMEQRELAEAEAELPASLAFVEEQAAAEGAERTESGLVIQEITPGTGPSPTATDVVTVHYHGTLRDGTVFDSSVERGEPATFPLNQVIPCWTEGLQSIRVGGKSRLTCPPDLAYGVNPPPGIPPNAALVFEVELLEIAE